MAAWLPWLLCLWLLAGDSEAVTFHKCPLAQIFLEEGLDGYAGIFLEDWMCVVYYSSWYDTESTLHTGYGLFQLNPSYWCKGPGIKTQNNCNICCSKLQDSDLRDDIACIKKVVRRARGLTFFLPWRTYCEGEDIAKWLDDCTGLERPWMNIS